MKYAIIRKTLGGEQIMAQNGFATICAMLDDKPHALEAVKPWVKLVVKWLVASKLGAFAVGAELLTKVGDFMTVSDALDLLDEILTPLKEWPWKRKEDAKFGYETARLANDLLVFVAYFDTVQSKHPWLWDVLDLDEDTKEWLVKKASDNTPDVGPFPSGAQIFQLKKEQETALVAFYCQLNTALRELSMGLVDAEKQRADWDQYPLLAVETYRENLQKLHAHYDSFRQWTDRTLLEDMAQDLAVVKTALQRMEEQYTSSQTVEPKVNTLPDNNLYLPLSTALLDNDFLGRNQELEQLWDVYNSGKRIAVLEGLGGMGKTELAIRFGQAYEAGKHGKVYLVSYRKDFRHTVTESIASGILGLLDQKLPEDKIYAIVMNELSKCNTNDLLILDNAEFENDTFDQLKRNLSMLKLRILITTRADVPGALQVGMLQREHLHGLFHKYGVEIAEAEIGSLIDAVEGHTLTIDLMARTMRGRRRVTAEQMLNALKEHTLPREQFRKIASSYPGSEKQAQIYEHLSAVFRVADLSEVEQNVLRCAVLLPRDGLDEQVFTNVLPVESVDTLDHLLDCGWLTIKGGLIFIHPVICMVCRETLKPDKNACWPFLSGIWNQYDRNSYHQHTIRRLAELFSNAVNVLPEKCISWTDLASWFYHELGEYELGLEYALKTLNYLKGIIPHDDIYLAIPYRNIGISYGKVGNRQKALEYKLLALSIQEKRLSCADPRLASTYSNIALTYGELHDYINALMYQRKALQIQKKVLSDYDLNLAITYNNIGCLCMFLGEYEKSLKFLNKALRIRIKVLGERHPYVVESYHNIAMTYVKKCEYRTALEFERRSLEIAESIMPAGHPFVQHPPKAIYRLEKLIARETEDG